MMRSFLTSLYRSFWQVSCKFLSSSTLISMKIIILIVQLTICFSLTSCVTYQYATIESDLRKNAVGEIIQENDTVQLRYRFSGRGCPVVVQVHNKLDVPVFLNWDRSAIVLDGKTLNASENALPFNAEISVLVRRVLVLVQISIT